MFIDAEKEGYNVKYPTVLSEEHKQMISLAQKGIAKGPFSEEHKQKLSLANKGKKLHRNWNPAKGSDQYNAKLTEEQAQYIIDNKGIIFQKDLAKELGVSITTIELIHRNISWKHLPRTKENTK
jgi:uncharacterized membrane protein